MVCTVGYQLRPVEELVHSLQETGVDTVIDVRETPWSYVSDYRAKNLEATLADAGIRYVHAQFAGNPKKLRREAASHAEILELYRAYLHKNPDLLRDFVALVEELTSNSQKVCLLCYERHPDDCHRSLLLEAAGWSGDAQHIGPEGAPRLLKA